MNLVQLVPLDTIRPHPKNPRRDLGDLAELTKSIKAQGIRQNLLLVPHCTGCPDVDQKSVRLTDQGWVCAVHKRPAEMRLVIGHRRKAAAELAGLDQVPAVIDPGLSEAEQIELMLLENLQRKEISPVEEAEGYQELLDLDVPVAVIAKKTGRAPKTIRDRLKLLDLPEAARERVHTGQGSLLDAAKLEEFADDPKVQADLAESIGTANFTQQLTSAREKRKREAEQQPIVNALLAKGLTEVSDARATGSWISACSEVETAEQLMLPERSVFIRSNWRAAVEVYGPPRAPLTNEEREAEVAARDESEAAWQAERARREADAAEAEECWKVRDAWIRERITGRFTHQQRAMIAERAAFYTLIGGGVSYTLGSWLGIDGYVPDSKIAKVAAKWAEDVDWAACLLVFLHLASGHSWERPSLPALYAVLEQLGYQVSDVERARLTQDAEAEDEDEAS